MKNNWLSVTLALVICFSNAQANETERIYQSAFKIAALVGLTGLGIYSLYKAYKPLIHYMFDEAVRQGFADFAQVLIKLGVDVDQVDVQGRTPLMRAAFWKDKKLVELLIKAGANINKTDENGWTPLMWATFNDCKEIVQLLIEAGAEVNQKRGHNNTALTHAVLNANPEIVALLVENNACIDQSEISLARQRAILAADEIMRKKYQVIAFCLEGCCRILCR